MEEQKKARRLKVLVWIWLIVLVVTLVVATVLTAQNGASRALSTALQRYEKKTDAAFVSNNHQVIYREGNDDPEEFIVDILHDYAIQPTAFLRVTHRYTYTVTISEQAPYDLVIYRMDWWGGPVDALLTLQCQIRPVVTMDSDEQVKIEIGEETLCYDVKKQTYLTKEEYDTAVAPFLAQNTYQAEVRDGTLTVTRLSDGAKKTATHQTLMQSADWADLYKASRKTLTLQRAVCGYGKVFLLYQDSQNAVLFQYDFDTETVSLHSWSRVYSDEPCQIFIYR